MLQLNRHDIPKLEEYWMQHKENIKLLQFLEWELLHNQETDENDTAGKNSVRTITKPTEQQAIKLASDKRYNNLKDIIEAIEHLYKNADDDIRTIVDMRYWDDDNNCYEWEEIAECLDMSRSKVLRLRNGLLDATAERIGWV